VKIREWRALWIHHMPKDEFQKRLGRIREQVGDTNLESTGIRDQALARLFVSSGWTQQELAEFVGKSQFWVSKRLLFGRFLGFISTGYKTENLPEHFPERRFRSFWSRTQGADPRQRFTHVLRLGLGSAIGAP